MDMNGLVLFVIVKHFFFIEKRLYNIANWFHQVVWCAIDSDD